MNQVENRNIPIGILFGLSTLIILISVTASGIGLATADRLTEKICKG
ncbi:MAG: hypothetical protein P8J75_08915 [Actinomycetota bacterium]|nr:hypothetical protein [Actinomycetota bacterium]